MIASSGPRRAALRMFARCPGLFIHQVEARGPRLVAMTRDEADDLLRRRKEEEPQFQWVVQRRAEGDWAVLRLPGGSGIDPSSVKGQKGEPVDVRDDPRVASERNIPPLGPGF